MTTPYDSNNKYKIRDDHIRKYEHMKGICHGDCAVVKLSQGFIAWVSQEDIDRVMTRNWHCKPNRGDIYAVSTDRSECKDARKLRLHHFIIGRRDGLMVDHINGNTLDNRRANLRHVSPAVNAINRHDKCGVTKHITDSGRLTDLWRASITMNGRWKNLGLYATYEAALIARINAQDRTIAGLMSLI